MFDPTIFDNLKVVLEGLLYDQDAKGNIAVTSREDLIDLASMGRTLRMDIRLLKGRCRATIVLSSGLPDFAAELRGLSAAGAAPGAELVLTFELPGELAAHYTAVSAFLEEHWGSEASISYEELIRYTGSGVNDRSFRAVIRFNRKIDESHIGDLESFVEHFVASLEFMERRMQIG